MILVTALLGAGFGLGVWVIGRSLVARPLPLASVFQALDRPARPLVGASFEAPGIERRAGAIAARLVEALGVDLGGRAVELRLTERTPARLALDKLVGAAGGLVVPLMVGVGLASVGIAFPAGGVVGLAIASAVAGWLLPDLVLRDDAAKRRTAFRHALSSYLDLVNVIIAGGGGIQTALYTAAEAGDGWAFAAIRRALDRARLTNRSPWDTFAELAAELDVPELAELAASVALAGSQGARIRASLAAKADTLRGHQVAETEAAAESATERMTIPVAVLLFGFLVFVAYPAVQQITTVSGPAGP